MINPVRLRHVVLLAADEEIRAAAPAIREWTPWVEVSVLTHPLAASGEAWGEPSVFLFDDTALALVRVDEIREKNDAAIIVLLSANPIVHSAARRVARERYPYTARADMVFATRREELTPARVVVSAVRAAEDRLNIQRYSGARRFIFLVVDDEPRWFSQFLPALYDIIGQRADVMITRSYDETLEFLFGRQVERADDDEGDRPHGHGDDVICLIADVFLPRGSEVASDAGLDLVSLVRDRLPHCAHVVASRGKAAERLGSDVFVMPKGDPGSLEKLQDYVVNHTGMGDFVVRDEAGSAVRRARNLREICGILEDADGDTDEAATLRERLDACAERDGFSTWLYLHSFRELGDLVRPVRARGRRLVETLRRETKGEIARVRKTPLVVGGERVFELTELAPVLLRSDPDDVEPLSDRDIISSWLDRKGFPELAEALRPFHGSGPELIAGLVERIEEWIETYRRRGDVL